MSDESSIRRSSPLYERLPWSGLFSRRFVNKLHSICQQPLCWIQLLDARCDQPTRARKVKSGTTGSRDVWCSPSELQNLSINYLKSLFEVMPRFTGSIFFTKLLCGFRMLRSHVTFLQGGNIVNFFWRLPLYTLRSKWTLYAHTNRFNCIKQVDVILEGMD